MFGVDVDEYLKAFCKPRVKVGTEWVNKGQTVDQVECKYDKFRKRSRCTGQLGEGCDGEGHLQSSV